MMNNNKNNLVQSRLQSIKYAVNGIILMFKREPNIKLHAIATVIVVIAGFIDGFNTYKWLALVFAISAVWITEGVNTAIEKLCDYSCGEQYHPAIKTIKDISAGAVLLAAISSIIIGILLFIN